MMKDDESQTSRQELEALLTGMDKVVEKKAPSYGKQVRDFERDVNRAKKRRIWAIPAAIASTILVSGSVLGYIAYDHIQSLTTAYETSLDQKNQRIETLDTALVDIIEPLYEKIDAIEDKNPGILLNARSILDTYTGAGGQLDPLSLSELKFLVNQYPEEVREADYQRYLGEYGLHLYAPREEIKDYVFDHLADNGRTIVNSEYGNRTHVTFNPDNGAVSEPWDGWYAIEGIRGHWQRNDIDGKPAFTKDVPHKGWDVYNDRDSRVYARHHAEVILYKDFHKDGWYDPYNDPLGRAIIYSFFTEGDEEIRVQIGHLDDTFDIPFEAGDTLEPGQVIGTLGTTGFTTGTHAHITYFRKDDGAWRAFDPYVTKRFNTSMKTLYVDYLLNE